MSDHYSDGEREPLVLRYEQMTGPISNLFASMREDPDVRQKFIESPADVVFLAKGEDISPQAALQANQLLFSLLSSQEVMSWLAEYSNEHRDSAVSRQRFIGDFSRALLERGGGNPALETLRTALIGDQEISIGDEVRTLVTESGIVSDSGIIIHSDIVSAGVLVTTDHKTEIHQTQDQVQDAQAHHDHSSTQSFQQSSATPVHGFEEGSQGFLVDPEYLRATADALVRRAVDLRQSGALGSGDFG